MFKAVKPIYEEIFRILNDERSLKKQPTLGIFSTVERGFVFRDPENISSALFPWAFVEWGGTDTIVPFRFNNVWTYSLTIPLVFMTYADRGSQDFLVFNPRAGNVGNRVNKNFGIGDIAQNLVELYWDSYHNNRLGLGPTEPPGQDYAIREWSLNTGPVTVPSVQFITQINPYIRGSQINFIVEVTETTPT